MIHEAEKDGSHPYPASKKSTTRRKQRPKGNKKGVVCWNCGRIGNISADCWHKKNNKQQETNNKSASNKYNKKKDVTTIDLGTRTIFTTPTTKGFQTLIATMAKETGTTTTGSYH